MGQINPVHTPKPYFPKIHFKIILPRCEMYLSFKIIFVIKQSESDYNNHEHSNISKYYILFTFLFWN
jgi:hypothetical protein